MADTTVDGVGLHTGAPCRVFLRGREGRVSLACGPSAEHAATIEELTIASTFRATTVEAHGGRLRVGTVEHALAALAGLGVHGGIGLSIDGPEMPLLDGGAAEWCDAIARTGAVTGPPRSRIARDAVIEVGASRYEFAPGEGVDVSVRFEADGLGSALLAPEARWAGGPDDFRRRIAPARTFALARDIGPLLEGGLARHVDRESVVVIGADGVHHAGGSFSPDEPARHKLLDLLGDLYLHGGPPTGRLHAVRPGHTANARAFARARAEGILVAVRS